MREAVVVPYISASPNVDGVPRALTWPEFTAPYKAGPVEYNMLPFEQPLLIECAGEQLVGIISRPPVAAPAALGVVIVVGGPQYRAGSHRMFVELARALATAGHAVLRIADE